MKLYKINTVCILHTAIEKCIKILCDKICEKRTSKNRDEHTASAQSHIIGDVKLIYLGPRILIRTAMMMDNDLTIVHLY